jgi:hypothetical protein
MIYASHGTATAVGQVEATLASFSGRAAAAGDGSKKLEAALVGGETAFARLSTTTQRLHFWFPLNSLPPVMCQSRGVTRKAGWLHNAQSLSTRLWPMAPHGRPPPARTSPPPAWWTPQRRAPPHSPWATREASHHAELAALAARLERLEAAGARTGTLASR